MEEQLKGHKNSLHHNLLSKINIYQQIYGSEAAVLTGELEKQFWKIKAPACFLSRPSGPANAKSGVVGRSK